MNIGKWALANSKLVYFIVAILTVGGVMSYNRMSKLEDPAIKVRQAVVVTTFPGASPHEVELQVTDPIEKAIRSMGGIDHIESRSSADLSIITVTLATTLPEDEIEQMWDLLRRKVADARAKLPPEAAPSLVGDDYGDVYGMFYALTSDGFTNKQSAQYAELIKREVLAIEGISKVELYGVMEPVIDITISEERMALLGVSPMEVLQTIEGQNRTVYSGYYKTGDLRLRVAVNDKYRTPREIEDLLIQGHEDDQMRVRDIATVEEGYADPVRNALYYDKMPAIGISISAFAGTDIVKLGRKVDARMAELRDSSLPVGIEYHKVFFQPRRVSDAIGAFMLNLVESVAIVVLVLMFAMGLRSGVLLGITLAVTVLGSLFFLDLLGGTLQRVSLASFILAMGMLVDNAIVVVDGILIDRSRGLLPARALTQTGKRTAMPLLGATLIAILAFFPLYLSEDTTGIYVRDLFVVLAVSLLLSWILSLVMVPPLAGIMLKKPRTRQGEPFTGRFYTALSNTLGWSLRHRTVTALGAFALVGLSAWAYTLLPQSFFPDMNYDQLYIEYKLPESSHSARTETDLMAICNYLLAREDVRHVTASVGATPSRYNLVRNMATPSLGYGEAIVDFTSQKQLVEAIPEIQEYLARTFPQAFVRVKRYNLMSNNPIEAMFTGPDPAVLASLTAQARAIMERSDKILLATSDWEPKTPLLEVDFNQSAARRAGLSRQDVGLSLLASTDGMPVNTLFDGTVAQTIRIRCMDGQGRPIEALENAPVFPLLPSLGELDRQTVLGLLNGAVSEEEFLASVLASTPLSQAARIRLKWEDPLVMRYNGQRAMRAQADNLPTVGVEDARKAIAEQVEAITLPEGYKLTWEGEYKEQATSMKYLFAHLPLAVVLMIGILILLFKDYRKPLIVILCVPLLFVGAVFGVLIAGKSFGFVAICGLLGLIGMMIKNGVVLMDEIDALIRRGTEPRQALLKSAATRFRPVMMASLTTILGMIPLLPDDMFGSLAATIMGGLLLGTLVTLVMIPVFYSILFRISIR